MEAEEVKEKFPNLFKGLGKLGDPYYLIKLKPDTKPHAIGTPWRVLVPLFRKSVKNCLGTHLATHF